MKQFAVTSADQGGGKAEEIFHDGNYLFPAEPIVAAPPAFELKETLPFGIDAREQVGIFLPYGFNRLQGLKILRKPGAIEQAIPEIGQEPCCPYAARQSAGDAHRIYARLAS